MGPRPISIAVPLRDLGSRTVRLSLCHAIRRGIPWRQPPLAWARLRYPDPVERLRESDEQEVELSIDPGVALALLDMARPGDGSPPSFEELMARHPSGRAAEELAERLEEAGRRRGPTGAGLVIRPQSSDLKREGEGWLERSIDLELTMLVMSKSSDHLYLAARRPVLHRIRTGVVLDLVVPSRRVLA